MVRLGRARICFATALKQVVPSGGMLPVKGPVRDNREPKPIRKRFVSKGFMCLIIFGRTRLRDLLLVVLFLTGLRVSAHDTVAFVGEK